MILNEKDRVSDGLLFAFLIASLALPESTFSFSLLSIGLIGCIILRFKPTPLSPYFFLAPASIYLAANLLYLYITETSGYLKLFSCAFLGLLFLSLAFKKTYRIRGDIYREKPTRIRLFVFLYFLSIFLLITNTIAAAENISPSITKSIQLSLYPVASAICFGSLIAIASRRLWLALALSTLYSAHVVIAAFNASDVSRLSILDYSLLLVLCFLFGIRYFSKSIITGSKVIGYIFSLLFLIQFVALYAFKDDLQIGGDALILYNAVKTIDGVSGKYEYLMPIHNGGLIFLPDLFWINGKPKAYNSSAWFIENIMGLSAVDYPWGVGISLFASSYLYAGFTGVVIIFYLIGLFIGKLSKLVSNSFWAGFFIYFLMRLPFSVFRMDETFMLGSFIPMIAAMALFVYFFQKNVNRIFNPKPKSE